MTITELGERESKGRPPIAELPLPPNVQQALKCRAQGSSWKDAAAAGNMEYRTLRRYVAIHPDSKSFLQQQTQDSLDESHSKLISFAPEAAEILIGIIKDPKIKAYSKIEAIDKFYRIIDKGFVDRNQEEKMEELREKLNAIEGSRIFDV